jgi:hypothetical protein
MKQQLTASFHDFAVSLVYGAMEIMAAFRLRGLAHSASRHMVHAH